MYSYPDLAHEYFHNEQFDRIPEVFRHQTRTKKSLFLTIVTTFGLMENGHSASLNAIGVNMDALFEKM